MNQNDVLKLFEEAADNLDNTHMRQKDTVLLLAQLIADSYPRLPQESIDALVHIGATIYRSYVSRDRARSEIATTMRESIKQENR